MNKKLLVLVPALAMILAGCGNSGNKGSSNGANSSVTPDSSVTSSSEAEAVESVQISKTEATLDIGGTLDLTAVAKPATLSDKSVVWSSSDDKVATVSTGGRVTAVGAGTCKIKAAATLDGSKFAECTITVNKEQVIAYVDTPELNKAYKFGTFQGNSAVNAMIYVSGNALESQRFTSTQNWAEANDFFFEAGSAEGKYKVAMGSGDAKQYLNVVSADDYHFVLGKTSTTEWEWDAEWCTIKTFTNKEYYFAGTYNNYTTISSCKLSMAAQDYVARFYVRADKCDPTGITLNETAADVYAGATLQLSARVAPLGASATEVKWSVSGNDKVTVSATGLVTVASDAVIGSTAKVTAKAGTVSAECTITVKEKLNYGTKDAPLNVAEAKALLDKFGKGVISSQRMYVKGIVTSNTALNSYKQTTAWLASDDGMEAQAFEIYSGLFDDAITGYDAAGSLVGKEVIAEGWGKLYNTTYEFTNKDASGAYDNAKIVSVKDGPAVAATAIALDKTEAEVEQGKTLQLKATLTPATANSAIAWTVEGNEKVTVSDAGLVTVAEDATGTATVKATSGTVSATCAITIKAKEATGGETPAETPLLTLTKDSITKLVADGSATSYATYNGDRVIDGYTITTNAVMPNVNNSQDVIQFKKVDGKITVKGIKATKVVITTENKNDLGANYTLGAIFGDNTFALSADEISASTDAKADLGSGVYAFTYEYAINAAAAGDLSITAGSGAAIYATSIVIY